MRFDIEVTWKHNPTGITETAIIPIFCSPDSDVYDRGYAADSESDKWYYESATDKAIEWYNENRLDLEGVTLDDWVDKFIEDCSVGYHLIS